MKYLIFILLTVNAYAGKLEGFTSPTTRDDNEACRGAEIVLSSDSGWGYVGRRDLCQIKAPALYEKYRTYSVLSCVTKKNSRTICKGYNVQVEDGWYVGVSNRDDLTELYGK